MCNLSIGENIRDRLPRLIMMRFECVLILLFIYPSYVKVISWVISKLIKLLKFKMGVVEMRTLKSNTKGQIEPQFKQQNLDALSRYLDLCSALFPQQALELVVREFQDNADAASQPAGTGKSIQWNGVRYMLTEVGWRGNIAQRVYATKNFILLFAVFVCVINGLRPEKCSKKTFMCFSSHAQNMAISV